MKLKSLFILTCFSVCMHYSVAQTNANRGLEIGISIGAPTIDGEIRNEFRLGSIGLTIEKSLNDRLGLRYQITGADTRGQDWRATAQSIQPQYRNYRNLLIDQSIQLVSFLTKPESNIGIILFGGVNLAGYHTETDLLDVDGHLYSYENIAAPTSFGDKSLILKDLESLQDRFYETPLKGDPLSKDYGNALKVRFGLSGGLGFRVPLSDRIKLDASYRLSWYNDSWLDGVNTSRLGTETNRKDLLHIPSVGLFIHLGNKSEDFVTVKEEISLIDQPALNSQDEALANRVKSLEDALYQLDRQVMDHASKQTKLEEKVISQGTAIASMNDAMMAIQGAVAMQNTFSRSIFFELGKSKIIPAHFSGLAQVSSYAEAYPNTQFEILGYADATGDLEDNEALAKKRAKATADFLIHTFGVDERRISIVVVGEVASADAQADIAAYRKVTIKAL